MRSGSSAREGGDDAYVETNAVHNALFARTCMMSRTAYKGCRIEFFPDQCAGPLPVPAIVSRSSRGGLAQLDPLSQLKMNERSRARGAGHADGAAKGAVVRNRFELLEVGDGDDDDEQEEDEGGESDEYEVSVGVRACRRRLSQASDGYDGYDDEETTTPGDGVRLGPCDSGTED